MSPEERADAFMNDLVREKESNPYVDWIHSLHPMAAKHIRKAEADERARLGKILRACPCDHCTRCARIVEEGGVK